MLFSNFKACFSPSVSRDVRVVWVQNGGTLAHTTADFYQSQYFLCAGLEDEWVGELMLKSRIAFHFDWVLQSVEQNCLAPVARFVLDDLFDEDELRGVTRISPKVTAYSNYEEVPKQQEYKQTKKRTRDELDTSVSDINLHISKRTRPNNTTPSMKRELLTKVEPASIAAWRDLGQPVANLQASERSPMQLADKDKHSPQPIEQAVDQQHSSPHQVRFYLGPTNAKQSNILRFFEPSSSPRPDHQETDFIRPLDIFRRQLQQMAKHKASEPSEFLIEDLCQLTDRPQLTLFEVNVEHAGKIFRVRHK